jgi:hypothetical protein
MPALTVNPATAANVNVPVVGSQPVIGTFQNVAELDELANVPLELLMPLLLDKLWDDDDELLQDDEDDGNGDPLISR